MHTPLLLRVCICAIIFCISIGVFSQGKFAGTKKQLIGTVFTDSKNIAGLENWEYKGGSVITPVNDPEMITVVVFQKGTTGIIIANYKEDTASAAFTIADVAEVKNIMKGWQIKTASCRQYKKENLEIVALVKWYSSKEILKPARQAWRFNRDKRRFEAISVKGIDCINEVD